MKYSVHSLNRHRADLPPALLPHSVRRGQAAVAGNAVAGDRSGGANVRVGTACAAETQAKTVQNTILYNYNSTVHPASATRLSMLTAARSARCHPSRFRTLGPQGKALSRHECSGNTKQRQCLSHEGSRTHKAKAVSHSANGRSRIHMLTASLTPSPRTGAPACRDLQTERRRQIDLPAVERRKHASCQRCQS